MRKNFNDYKTIKTTRKEYEKKGSKWIKVGEKKELFSEKQYNNFTDVRWAKFNRALGGYERAEKNFTSRGYRVTRNTSISPDRQTKIVREFDFAGSNRLYDRAYNNYSKPYRSKRKK